MSDDVERLLDRLRTQSSAALRKNARRALLARYATWLAEELQAASLVEGKGDGSEPGSEAAGEPDEVSLRDLTRALDMISRQLREEYERPTGRRRRRR